MKAKTKIATFAAVLGVGHFGICIAAPERSMLGADGIGLQQKESTYTAADYIQDGLVNLWDAVENAGWGEHVDYSTSWTDLVGGFVLQTGGGVTGDFTGGYAHYKAAFFNGAGDPSTLRGVRYYNKAIRQRQVINSGRWTIEIVHRPKSATSYLYLFGLMYSHTALCMEPSRLIFRSGILLSGTSLPYTPRVSNTKESRSIICSADEMAIHTYKDGIADSMSELNSSTVWAGNHSGPLLAINTCIGFTAYSNPNNWDANQMGVSDIYCFRVYNRPLTEEEIAYNYSIDQMRFGL